MSKRNYPRLGSASKRQLSKNEHFLCQACGGDILKGENMVCIDIQNSYMRGEDDVLFLHPKCAEGMTLQRAEKLALRPYMPARKVLSELVLSCHELHDPMMDARHARNNYINALARAEKTLRKDSTNEPDK